MTKPRPSPGTSEYWHPITTRRYRDAAADCGKTVFLISAASVSPTNIAIKIWNNSSGVKSKTNSSELPIHGDEKMRSETEREGFSQWTTRLFVVVVVFSFLLFLQSLVRYCGALQIPRGCRCAAKPPRANRKPRAVAARLNRQHGREKKKKIKLIGLCVTAISPNQFSLNAFGSRYFSIRSRTTPDSLLPSQCDELAPSRSLYVSLSLSVNKQVPVQRHTLYLKHE